MYDVHVCDCFIINVLDSDQDQTDQSDDEAFTPSEQQVGCLPSILYIFFIMHVTNCYPRNYCCIIQVQILNMLLEHVIYDI
jgi:hypothetical protein